ncbi:hypothetical protein JS756_27730 [Streptomyces actuosus]|uniref:Uncharacterized protein n=1 Tax=Streptomyces actuosus TaxID=1885 RepID=A0ABS2VXF7_STRAS|nr:hypothetical protein [Streptomyces actuosus]MBN0047833.1 hypothetical protein [Streptomyces actuosus]
MATTLLARGRTATAAGALLLTLGAAPATHATVPGATRVDTPWHQSPKTTRRTVDHGWSADCNEGDGTCTYCPVMPPRQRGEQREEAFHRAMVSRRTDPARRAGHAVTDSDPASTLRAYADLMPSGRRADPQSSGHCPDRTA